MTLSLALVAKGTTSTRRCGHERRQLKASARLLGRERPLGRGAADTVAGPLRFRQTEHNRAAERLVFHRAVVAFRALWQDKPSDGASCSAPTSLREQGSENNDC